MLEALDQLIYTIIDILHASQAVRDDLKDQMKSQSLIDRVTMATKTSDGSKAVSLFRSYTDVADIPSRSYRYMTMPLRVGKKGLGAVSNASRGVKALRSCAKGKLMSAVGLGGWRKR